MLFEGTGKYFLLLFIYLVVVIFSSRLSLARLLKNAHEKSVAMFIPIYNKYYLVKFLDLKKNVFWLSLIPIVNLYYDKIIIERLLEAFGQDQKEAILYLIVPMYKFAELAAKNPKFILNEYNLTNEFLDTQNALYSKKPEELPDKIKLVGSPNVGQEILNNFSGKAPEEAKPMGTLNDFNQSIVSVQEPEKPNLNQGNFVNNSFDQNITASTNSFDQNITPVEPQTLYSSSNNTDYMNNNYNNLNNMNNNYNMNNYNNDNVFTNNNLVPDERHETVVTAVNEEKKEENPINEFKGGKLEVCPNCGTRLAPGATTCFMCGYKIIK